MYDILQLNDMLVPELQDIAEQLAIPNFKKIDKQDLIYKILDIQSTTAMNQPTKGDETEKPKRKRTLKVLATTNTTKEELTSPEKPKAEVKAEQRPAKKKMSTL